VQRERGLLGTRLLSKLVSPEPALTAWTLNLLLSQLLSTLGISKECQIVKSVWIVVLTDVSTSGIIHTRAYVLAVCHLLSIRVLLIEHVLLVKVISP
jgi:hypothetical protein